MSSQRQRSICFIVLVMFVVVILRVTGHAGEDEATDSFTHQAKDVAHIKQHLKENLGMDEEAAQVYLKEMESEVQFFMMNDLNNDSRIDGLEIYKIITHRHDHEESEAQKTMTPVDEESIARYIDKTLQAEDQNDDGYIDYAEFLRIYRPDLHIKATGKAI